MTNITAIQIEEPIALNFFQQMLERSLQTAYRTLTAAKVFTAEIRNRALSALDVVFKLDVTDGIWAKASQLILALSPKMEQSGFWDRWLPYLQRALQMSRSFLDQQTEGALGVQIGNFLQRLGQHKAANSWYQASIVCAKTVGDNSTWISALNRLGFIAYIQNRVTESSEYIEKALSLMSAEDPQQEYSYLVLGNLARSQNEPEKAVAYYQRSFELCQQSGDKHKIAGRLNNLGLALNQQGMYQAALDAYNKAASLWEEVNDPVELAITQMNQGNTYGNLGERQRAIEYYERAKPILEQARNSVNLAKLYNNQGYCYFLLQEWQKAEKLYQISLTEWKQLESWFDYAYVLDNLGQVYGEQGRWDQAIETFEEALQILADFTETCVSRSLLQEIREHLQHSRAKLA